MKKFRLIKEYPGSPELGIIKPQDTIISGITFFNRNEQPNRDWIENYPEYWEEVIEKDYEILQVKCIHNNGALRGLLILNKIYDILKIENDNLYLKMHPNTGIYLGLNPTDKTDFHLYSGFVIYSVKRKSDGEVFTFGDKLETGIIKQFYLPDNIQKEITIYVTKDDEDTYLSEAKHEKLPLFTTEDGVDIFEGDSLFQVRDGCGSLLNKINSITAAPDSIFNKNTKYMFFSVKQAAEKYINDNKPIYSKTDMFSFGETVAARVHGDLKWIFKYWAYGKLK